MNHKSDIVPAIIPESLADLKSKLSLVKGKALRAQIDVLDGKYTPFTSWPYNDSPDFQKIVSGEEGLPHWQDFSFEIDMMVSSPEEKYEDWISAGADALIIHFESLDKIDDFEKIKKDCALKNVFVGLAFRPKTPISEVQSLLRDADFVQLMGNDEIGRQGVSLDEKVYEKVRELRNKFPQIPIAVDIGVNFETALRLLQSGVNKLVSGSAIFSGDIEDNIKRFRDIISTVERGKMKDKKYLNI